MFYGNIFLVNIQLKEEACTKDQFGARKCYSLYITIRQYPGRYYIQIKSNQFFRFAGICAFSFGPRSNEGIIANRIIMPSIRHARFMAFKN
jgi:hypothetical protein